MQRKNALSELERLKADMARTAIDHQSKYAESTANNAALQRKVNQLTEENSKTKLKMDDVHQRLANANDECQRLKQQIQQKELILLENHSAMNTKFVDARSEWEKERSTLKVFWKMLYS